jgi:hypothetical protein
MKRYKRYREDFDKDVIKEISLLKSGKVYIHWTREYLKYKDEIGLYTAHIGDTQHTLKELNNVINEININGKTYPGIAKHQNEFIFTNSYPQSYEDAIKTLNKIIKICNLKIIKEIKAKEDEIFDYIYTKRK